MSYKPEYKSTRFQIISQIITLFGVVAYYVVLIINWGNIPDKIPMHYNFEGEIDRMGDKGSIIGLAVVLGMFYLIFLGIQHLPLTWNLTEKPEIIRRKAHNIIKNLLICVNFIFVLIFSYITFCVASGERLGIWFAPIVSYGVFAMNIGFIIALFITTKKSQ